MIYDSPSSRPGIARLAQRVGSLYLGLVLFGLSMAMFVNAGLTALLRFTTLSTGVLKTGIEVVVVGVGWLLGGSLGIGTFAFAVGVGPTIQLLVAVFPWLALRTAQTAAASERAFLRGDIS